MTHLIYTYCNANKGDQLVNDWLYSLHKHVDLTDIDVMVIDFGLTESQRARLRDQGRVQLWPGQADARMSNIQYRELSAFLATHKNYDQICYSDCGDVIFQDDISNLFYQSPDLFKAVIEPEFNFSLHRITLGVSDVRPECLPEIAKTLGLKPTANCGFLIGPATKMGAIWETYSSMCRSAARHGTDQLLINYLLHRDGFAELPRRFNFVTFLNGEAFHYDAERFLADNAGIIPVVHNAGRYDFARTIARFGYRRGRIKPPAYYNGIRLFYWVLGSLYVAASTTQNALKAKRGP
ncbi:MULTISPECIES: hypothetical protein [unclassified Mesorhizobium]|uniref:hypothetical protein n=1 Tax=unclassified Mesorhizobium TaxID=325217 RepID=UPI003334A8BE